MADAKLTALTEETTPADADLMYLVDDVAGTPTSKRITWANIKAALRSALVSDTAYGSGWNGDTTTAPSKNAVYDKIETMGGRLLALQQRIITAGDYGTGSVGFGWQEPWGSGQDQAIAAVAGDRIKVTINANLGTGTGSDYLDAVIVASGTHVGVGGASGTGMVSATNTNLITVAPSRWVTLVSGDISGGNATFRIKTRTTAGRTLYANSNSPTVLILENWGQ